METLLNHLKALTSKELLQLSAAVGDELVARGVSRTGNNPISGYTEWLVSERLNLTLATNSEKGFDAVDPITSEKYEIKARRITPKHKSRQLSQIRDLEGRHFDYLIAVVYSQDLEIILALKISYAVVVAKAKSDKHTNSYRMDAADSLLGEPGVEDITCLLQGGLLPA